MNRKRFMQIKWIITKGIERVSIYIFYRIGRSIRDY